MSNVYFLFLSQFFKYLSSDSLISLFVLQAIGDPSQGWANAILFIFFAPKIRSSMIQKCRACLGRKRNPNGSYDSQSSQGNYSLKSHASDSDSSPLVASDKEIQLLSSSAIESKELSDSDSEKSDAFIDPGDQ